MISSIIYFTFNVVYLPSVFLIISTKLLIRYICDISIHHKENKQAEFTRGRVDSGAELVPGRVDPLPTKKGNDSYGFLHTALSLSGHHAIFPDIENNRPLFIFKLIQVIHPKRVTVLCFYELQCFSLHNGLFF